MTAEKIELVGKVGIKIDAAEWNLVAYARIEAIAEPATKASSIAKVAVRYLGEEKEAWKYGHIVKRDGMMYAYLYRQEVIESLSNEDINNIVLVLKLDADEMFHELKDVIQKIAKTLGDIEERKETITIEEGWGC